jgi:hypothetical protein
MRITGDILPVTYVDKFWDQHIRPSPKFPMNAKTKKKRSRTKSQVDLDINKVRSDYSI